MMMNHIPEGWIKYGVTGLKTVEIRNMITRKIMRYCSNNGIDYERDVYFAAGAMCFVYQFTGHLTLTEKEEIKQILIENAPTDYPLHLIPVLPDA